MVRVGIIGLGKMGISHLSILGAHPKVEIVGVCDTSSLVLSVLDEYCNYKCFKDYNKMLDETMPDAVFVAVPTKFHASLVKSLLKRQIHVFVEKPFCLNAQESLELVQLAASVGVVNQVGYHNRFVGTFKEVNAILKSNSLGSIIHFSGEAYGPVVTRKSQSSWRSDPGEGGGCLMDYASHVIDLIEYLVGPVQVVNSADLKRIYSAKVDDAVYASLLLKTGISGSLSVNWSDSTYRKMSTSVTIIGSMGKIISDANELKVYFNGKDVPLGYSRGWNVKYVTELTDPVNFYLRGEEYSAQIDCFISNVLNRSCELVNSFASAARTDQAIELIKQKSIWHG